MNTGFQPGICPRFTSGDSGEWKDKAVKKTQKNQEKEDGDESPHRTGHAEDGRGEGREAEEEEPKLITESSPGVPGQVESARPSVDQFSLQTKRPERNCGLQERKVEGPAAGVGL